MVQSFFVCKMQAGYEMVRDTVGDILAYYTENLGELCESSYDELKIVLNELLNNAVKHGNQGDADKHVEIVAGITGGDCAMVVVLDEGAALGDCAEGSFANFREKRAQGRGAGEGDEPDAALALSLAAGCEPDLDLVMGLAESGRGILIVRNLCDDFMVNARGNRVMICKRLQKK
jgi:serine/threonine-protein kinase RsbW